MKWFINSLLWILACIWVWNYYPSGFYWFCYGGIAWTTAEVIAVIFVGMNKKD
jgi:F0F1-type ATP synthase assembly protein I